jgi:MarR family transcriptional regulator, organic hydroperoxide resistance regulator
VEDAEKGFAPRGNWILTFDSPNQMICDILPEMSRTAEVETVLECYPQIYFACHRRHVRDEQTATLLSSHQASVLDHLDTVEGTSLLELAQHMGVTPSTMCLTIDRLERGGYVTRGRSKADRRRAELKLTAAGARIKRQQKVLEPELVAAMLARLDPQKREAALHGLQLLAEAAGEMVRSGDFRRILKGAAG